MLLATSTARRTYREAGQASIRLCKLYFYLETHGMLRHEGAMHPIEGKRYETARVPTDVADSGEWNYLISFFKYQRYRKIADLFDSSDRLGNKMLRKVNEIRPAFPITRENITKHIKHHGDCIEAEGKDVDKERIERLIKFIENTRIGIINTIVINLHYL